MASISHVIDKHFRTDDNLASVVDELDSGIYVVALSVRTMRDMMLHGTPSSPGRSFDTEEGAAAAQALLAYIGQLGALVDKLERIARPQTGRGVPSGNAGNA